jgi:hypothetical protein
MHTSEGTEIQSKNQKNFKCNRNSIGFKHNFFKRSKNKSKTMVKLGNEKLFIDQNMLTFDHIPNCLMRQFFIDSTVDLLNLSKLINHCHRLLENKKT